MDVKAWLPILLTACGVLISASGFWYLKRKDRTQAWDARLQAVTERLTIVEREQVIGFATSARAQALTDQSLNTHTSENNFRFQAQEQRVQHIEARMEKVLADVHDDVKELAEAVRSMAQENAKNIRDMSRQHQATLTKILEHLTDSMNNGRQ